jgi:hypothetical protein
MSSHSTKTAGRSSKTARRPDKKSAKSARTEIKKSAKSARRPVGKSARPGAATAIRAPSIAPKSTPKSAPKSARKPAEPMFRTPSPPMQPMAAHDIKSMAHKYQVGETVYFTSPTFGRAAASGSYTVVKLLPSEGDDYQYRIKSSGEAFERVAKESQLDRV